MPGKPPNLHENVDGAENEREAGMSKKNGKNGSLYNQEAYCSVCDTKYLARYNMGKRAKVCTPPDHECQLQSTKRPNGTIKTIPCIERCCRSRDRSASSGQMMDQAIDERKLLDPAEFRKFMKEAHKLKDPVGIAIRFIAKTGGRLGEGLLVRVRDLDLHRKIPVVKIPTLKRGNRPLRTVDLQSAEIVKELKAWAKGKPPMDFLFPVPRRTLQRNVTKILKKLKLEKDSCVHLLRHTRATQLLTAGASWTYLRQQMGWSNLEMAKIYTHTGDQERLELVSSKDI